MDKFRNLVLDRPAGLAIASLLVGTAIWATISAISNVYLHRLSKHAGPRLAAASDYYKAYIELIKAESWHLHLRKLHAQYGPVVRVGPNELHFEQPQAYHDIYNNANRWDKEINLYHSFGEDESSFGYLTWKEAKPRKDVLGPSFSAKAIAEARNLVQDKIDALCAAFTRLAQNNQSANLTWAYRCMTLDIITYYCFGKSVDAIEEPGFKAPIIVAMDASLPVFVAFKHSSLFKNMIMKSPRPFSRLTSPATSGLVDLQEMLETQIHELSARPDQMDLLPHRMTIYHSLLSRESSKSGSIPSTKSLYDEAQALMFAGADTVGNTLMLGSYYILRNPRILSKLKTELLAVFPDPQNPPAIAELEQLPYLNACVRESLRMSSGVVSGLPRIVPSSGAKIAGHDILPGTVVSIGSTFVHYNKDIFADPETFSPERWIAKPDLDHWLVPFSRGPRSCLGINLAWLELRLAMACVFRRFDLELESTAPKQLRFREAFLPIFIDGPIMARVVPVKS